MQIMIVSGAFFTSWSKRPPSCFFVEGEVCFEHCWGGEARLYLAGEHGVLSAHQLSQACEHWHMSKMLQRRCRHMVRYFSAAPVGCLKIHLWLTCSKRIHCLARIKSVSLQIHMVHLQVLLLFFTKQHLS